MCVRFMHVYVWAGDYVLFMFMCVSLYTRWRGGPPFGVFGVCLYIYIRALVYPPRYPLTMGASSGAVARRSYVYICVCERVRLCAFI